MAEEGDRQLYLTGVMRGLGITEGKVGGIQVIRIAEAVIAAFVIIAIVMSTPLTTPMKIIIGLFYLGPTVVFSLMGVHDTDLFSYITGEFGRHQGTQEYVLGPPETRTGEAQETTTKEAKTKSKIKSRFKE